MSNKHCCLVWMLVVVGMSASWGQAVEKERPTLNCHTCDPRPDILPTYLHHIVPEYRQVYNRPRFSMGYLAYKFAPTSQEAMVWCENHQAGAYRGHHNPPRYKRYFAPKPWEVLQTGARPDFPDRGPPVPLPENTEAYEAVATPEIDSLEEVREHSTTDSSR